MNHPYPVLDALRKTTEHDVPLGVTLELCSICHTPIKTHEDATVFQEVRNGPAYMVHHACHDERLRRIVRAMGRVGSRRIGAALRLSK